MTDLSTYIFLLHKCIMIINCSAYQPCEFVVTLLQITFTQIITYTKVQNIHNVSLVHIYHTNAIVTSPKDGIAIFRISCYTLQNMTLPS